MRRFRSACSVASAVALTLAGACNQPEQPAVAPPEPTAPSAAPAATAATWTCESGATVAVAYPETGAAQITYKGRVHALRSAQSASGARYIGSGIEWWTVVRDGVEQGTLGRLGPDQEVAVAPLERCSAPTTGDAPAGVLPPQPEFLPASAPCQGPQLKLSRDGGDAGMGHRVAIIGVQNVGTRPCSLTGYATVTLQDGRGRAIETVRAEQNPGSYLRAGQAPTPVELAPKAKAFFDLAWTVVPNEADGETVCPSAAKVRVTAPADTAVVSLDQAFTPCGRRVQVSPFRSVAEPDAVPSATPRAKT